MIVVETQKDWGHDARKFRYFFLWCLLLAPASTEMNDALSGLAFWGTALTMHTYVLPKPTPKGIKIIGFQLK